jgi:hypothetical protein
LVGGTTTGRENVMQEEKKLKKLDLEQEHLTKNKLAE